MSIEDRLAVLKNKLRTREGAPGYEKNVEAIKQEIVRLETLLVASSDDPGDKK
jgi:hypothetical protein